MTKFHWVLAAAGGRMRGMEAEQKVAPWKWDKGKHDAAQLLATDELTDQEIADQVGVQRKTLWAWKKKPEFSARVKELTDALGDVAMRYAIGRRSRRVAALNDRWERMKRVVLERAAAQEMQNAAGGQSGVLAHTMKSIGAGPNAEKVDEYAFDAALLKELREHEKQAAQELGQWIEKSAVDGNLTLGIVEEIVDNGDARSEDDQAPPGASGVPAQ